MMLGSLLLYQGFEKRKYTRLKILKSASFRPAIRRILAAQKAQPRLWRGWANNQVCLKILSSYRYTWLGS
jgi:hypothetical protein